MKKSLVIFTLCVAVLLNGGITFAKENKVLESEVKEAHLIDDTKMQEKQINFD